jgi:ParB family transcriptional regulator, chromosome partitioning protein
MAEKRPALGKGLSALIPSAPEPRHAPTEIDIDLLSPNKYQPRSRANDANIDELARSIKANGIIQPIVVRKVGESYQIIAGERRWRAAQRAGLLRVPITVRDVPGGSDVKLLEMALIENIQREDLNPIEEATAYRRLVDEFHMTQDAVAAAVGKERSTVANCLRLLKLPQDVRDQVSAGRLSMGHARALLAVENATALCRLAQHVVDLGLSVRQTEKLVNKATAPGTAKGPAAPPPADVHTRAAEERLRIALGTRVKIVRKGKGGTVEIDFSSEDELNRIYDSILQATR